jgi:hypothetical protein
MEALTAMALVSTGIQVVSALKSSKEQADAMRRQAELNRLKAQEILERNRINNELTLLEAEGLSADQIVGGAARGIAGGSQATLGTVQKIQELAARKIIRDTRNAEFEATMARLGANIDVKAAGEVEKAGAWNAFGAAIGGASRAYELQMRNDASTKSGASGQNVLKPGSGNTKTLLDN